MGSQNVAMRNRRTAAIAWWAGMPMAVSPAAMTASTPPSPPGVGVADPTALPARKTTAAGRMGAHRPQGRYEREGVGGGKQQVRAGGDGQPEGMGDRVKVGPRPQRALMLSREFGSGLHDRC